MSIQPYCIPDTQFTVLHVNAIDLNAGTAKIGAAWTPNSTPLFIPAGGVNQTLIPVEGTFTGGYFTQASSPAVFGTSPFTIAMLVKTGRDVTSQQILFAAPQDASGYYVQMTLGRFKGPNVSSTVPLAFDTGYVVIFGGDGVHSWIAVNGETPVLGTVLVAGAGTTAMLGKYSTGTPFSGSFAEVMASTDTPTVPLFASLYASIVAALANQPPLAPLPVTIPNPLVQGIIGGVDFGSDIDATYDLNPELVLLSGHANLAQALLHRLKTPRGSLAYDPNYGTDVRAFLNDSMTPVKLSKLRSDVQGECLKDERVQTASCQAVPTPAKNLLTLTISLNTANGPFVFVLAVTSLSVALLAPPAPVN